MAVGACGQRDECLLKKRACDPVPRIGLFHAGVPGGLRL